MNDRRQNERPMHLTKHHGLGNDFLVLLGRPEAVGRADAELARRLCDRHRGIGADGLLVGELLGGDGAELTMTLFNADGSRAEVSGNGLRCLAQAEARRRRAETLDVLVSTDAGARRCCVWPGGDPATVDVRVDLGPARVRMVDDAPGQRAAAVDIGNPHLVLLDDPAAPLDVAAEGCRRPELNVEVVRSVNGDRVEMEVWERGVGRTQACGSGAAAVGAAAVAWGLTGPKVTVAMPGGAVTVVVGDTVELTGPAVFVADIEVDA